MGKGKFVSTSHTISNLLNQTELLGLKVPVDVLIDINFKNLKRNISILIFEDTLCFLFDPKRSWYPMHIICTRIGKRNSRNPSNRELDSFFFSFFVFVCLRFVCCFRVCLKQMKFEPSSWIEKFRKIVLYLGYIII